MHSWSPRINLSLDCILHSRLAVKTISYSWTGNHESMNLPLNSNKYFLSSWKTATSYSRKSAFAWSFSKFNYLLESGLSGPKHATEWHMSLISHKLWCYGASEPCANNGPHRVHNFDTFDAKPPGSYNTCFTLDRKI